MQAQTLEKRHGIEFISANAWANTPQAQQILSDLKALLNPNEMVFPVNSNNRWDKWLNEDVAFLITPKERAEFLALTSDEQREQFVDQFWEKRNPDPGFGFNAFKEEHYRRVAYANDHFAVHDAAGWQTDRGRTYIVMGPPHIRDVLPDQEHERWRYPVRGTVDFVTILFDISDKGGP